MKIIIFIILGLFLTTTYNYSTENKEIEQSVFKWRKIENKAFSVNEKLDFSVRFGILNLGDATMEVKSTDTHKGRKVYRLFSGTKSNSFCDKFYQIRNSEESWMDIKSLCSLKYIKYSREGSYTRDEIVKFDYLNGEFYLKETDPSNNDTIVKEKKGRIPAFVNDSLSSFYFIRTLPLEVGKEFYIDMHSGDRSYPMKIIVHKKQKIKVPYGKFKCYVVEPVSREGEEGPFKLKIWMTADDRKIPVKIKTKSNIGSITMKLKNISE